MPWFDILLTCVKIPWLYTFLTSIEVPFNFLMTNRLILLDISSKLGISTPITLLLKSLFAYVFVSPLSLFDLFLVLFSEDSLVYLFKDKRLGGFLICKLFPDIFGHVNTVSLPLSIIPHHPFDEISIAHILNFFILYPI